MSSLTLLPLSPCGLQESQARVLKEMVKEGLSEHESLLKLDADFNDWLDDTTNDQLFPKAIAQILDRADWFSQIEKPRKKGAGLLYELMIHELSKSSQVSRRAAAITLSYLPLMVMLVSKFHLSAAGVAKILNESDKRVLLHWKGIDKILRLLGMLPSLGKDPVNSLLAEDRKLMHELFKDADVNTIVEVLCYEAKSFELGSDFNNALSHCLQPHGEKTFIPYLQTLFYLCAITEFFDHPLEYLYTFKPRGNVANTIFDVFPAEMAATGNPILNNFKAIDRLSYDWSRSRDDYPIQANSLVTIILGLSSLSYSSRQCFTQKIRCGLLRYIEVMSPDPVELKVVKKIETIRRFLNRVADGETNTFGIIEQRVTDFLSAVLHRDPKWRVRGLRDPVNATNTASGKLGDSDFQNATERKCVAVEAHAGRLTPVYVNEHLRTLRRNLPKRVVEWANISELEEWKLEVVFVVHENGFDEIPRITELDVECNIRIVSYRGYAEQVLADCKEKEKLTETFNRLVIDVLNASNSPHKAKIKAQELLSG